MSKSPTRHFIYQRITAVLNIPLSVFLLYLIFTIPSMSYMEVSSLFQKPHITLLTIILIINFSYHMKLGMQMIIEDYIHGANNLKVALLLNNILISIVITGSIYSVVTI